MSVKEIIQKSGYLSRYWTKQINSLSCRPVSESKLPVVIHSVCSGSSRSWCESKWQTYPLLEFPMSRRLGSLFRGGDSTLLLWADLVETDGPLSCSGSLNVYGPDGYVLSL